MTKCLNTNCNSWNTNLPVPNFQAQYDCLLAMSGGVDSTAAALLLQERGLKLIGCTFRTRYTSPAFLQSAADIAQRLAIPHFIIDYSQSFDNSIIRYFCSEYTSGRTPNPCVLCNRFIKFGALMDEADKLGCSYIATGHYARLTDGFLSRAADATKDQTYFLWQLPRKRLSRILFPLGDMLKKDVRNYLSRKGFTDLAQHGESQDICFISSNYRSFINKSPFSSRPSSPVSLSLSPALRQEVSLNSIHLPLTTSPMPITHYTIGQRKGLGVALGVPAFVTHIDAEHNEVTLGTHDELYTSVITLKDVSFYGDHAQPIWAQIRYRSLPVEATIQLADTRASIHFFQPVWAPTPGQSCVFYQSSCVVGGGIIV